MLWENKREIRKQLFGTKNNLLALCMRGTDETDHNNHAAFGARVAANNGGKRCEDQDGNVLLDANCAMVKRKKTEQAVVSSKLNQGPAN